MCVIILITLQSVSEIIILCKKQKTLDLILNLIQTTMKQDQYKGMMYVCYKIFTVHFS